MRLGINEITYHGSIDFRGQPFHTQPGDFELAEGMRLACRSSFHIYDQAGAHSSKIYLEAEYTGTEAAVGIPKVKYQPQRNLIAQDLPIFEVSVSSSDLPAQYVGQAAIAYLFESQTPGIFGLDPEALNATLGVIGNTPLKSHLGLITKNSIHSITRATD